MELTDESHWGEVFERNGRLVVTSMGHKSLGKWRVQKDQLCLDPGTRPGGGCYEVWLAGNKVELRNQSSGVPLEGTLRDRLRLGDSRANSAGRLCPQKFDGLTDNEMPRALVLARLSC